MRRALLTLVACAIGASFAAVGCSQTPVVVPLRSMERPKDVDFLCMQQLDAKTWRGVPLNRCHVDQNANPAPYEENGALEDPNVAINEVYHLHAVVTQLARGELAVVDLGNGPNDSTATILKVDPRIPGYTFLPVGSVPEDVVADPRGKAVYVASGKLVTDGTPLPHYRIDVIPSEVLRGPIDTYLEEAGSSLPWPHIELSLDDGAPTRMATFDDADRADGAGHDRLYVALPDAKGGPKIAVFEIGCPLDANIQALCPTALLPRRVGDIALTASPSPQITRTTLSCNTAGKDPWWLEYEKNCYSPALQSPNPATPPNPDVVPPVQVHLGGIAVANGLLYVSDDGAPLLHVFDISAGHAVELQRITLGAKTSRLAVSPIVPDEVTFANGNAIEVCEAMGWLGDGIVHTESAIVASELGGKCKAHRYIYAVDYQDARLGDGTIAVVDLPVTFSDLTVVDAKAPADENKFTVRVDTPDWASISLEQPMGCDTPALTATRIPLGNFAIGGGFGVPGRAVTFITYDPPSPRQSLTRQRCRSWQDANGAVLDSFPTGLGASKQELDTITDPQTKANLVDAQNSWTDGVGPTRLRGTFAFVALDNGAISIVDIDDYDSLCRGPTAQADVDVSPLQYPTGPKVTSLVTPQATGEYTYGVVRRHHPRSARYFNADNPPAVNSILLSSDPTPSGTALAWGVDTPEQRVRAHFFLLSYNGTSTIPSPVQTDYIKTSADNPFGYAQESWTITYQGVVPGYGGTGGTIESGNVFRDPNGLFCERGVEAFEGDPFAHNDVVQITDDVCLDANAPKDQLASHTICPSTVTHDQCEHLFGPSTEELQQASQVSNLDIRRDLVIGKAFDRHLEIAEHYVVDATTSIASLQPGLPDHLTECFPGLIRYVVRARDTWVVNGSVTGYLHRVIPKASAGPPDPDPECVVDTTKPLVYNGRVHEIPGTVGSPSAGATLPGSTTTNVLQLAQTTQVCPTKDAPLVFVNPYWTFAIQQGWDPNLAGGGGPVATPRDYTFTFAARYDYFPYTGPGGSMPQTIRALQQFKYGTDVLNWDMISLVDAVDKGLGIFFVWDFNTSKVFE